MTAKEAISYIENYTWSASRPGPGRTRELLSALGNPQKKLKFVHVAGSNGKGSTCAMLESILRQAGYRTGLYISPYIENFCERIQAGGRNIPEDSLAAVTERVRAFADRMEDHPSQFELVTAIAMEYFYESRCQIVVLETGMGGALDSTNAIDAPEVAVLTNIGLEHTEYLGSTLEEIAATKAGILKSGCHAVCYGGAPEVTSVIRSVCRQKQIPLACVDFQSLQPAGYSLDGQSFLWHGRTFTLSLLGAHQLCNAAVVLEAVGALNARGWKIGGDAAEKGLALARWPARFEILSRSPLFILDGAHNPQCAQALAESIRQFAPGKKAVFCIGVLANKDYRQILRHLLPLAQACVCVTPGNPLALPAEKLMGEIIKQGGEATACPDIASGIRKTAAATGADTIAVACGSLYLAGAVRSLFFS